MLKLDTNFCYQISKRLACIVFVDGGAQRKWTDMCGKDSPVPLGGEGKSRLPGSFGRMSQNP